MGASRRPRAFSRPAAMCTGYTFSICQSSGQSERATCPAKWGVAYPILFIYYYPWTFDRKKTLAHSACLFSLKSDWLHTAKSRSNIEQTGLYHFLREACVTVHKMSDKWQMMCQVARRRRRGVVRRLYLPWWIGRPTIYALLWAASLPEYVRKHQLRPIPAIEIGPCFAPIR